MDKRKKFAKQFRKEYSKWKKDRESFTIDEILAFFAEQAKGIKLTEEEQAKILANRSQVLNHVIQNPGTFLEHVEKELNINRYMLILHLNILLDFNLIKRKKMNSLEVYYHADVNSEDAIKNFRILKEEFYFNDLRD